MNKAERKKYKQEKKVKNLKYQLLAKRKAEDLEGSGSEGEGEEVDEEEVDDKRKKKNRRMAQYGVRN